LGEQQMEARNPIAALRTFGDAFRLDPNNRATNYFLGELYLQQRDLKLAMEHLERALAGDDDYPPAEGALGAALRLQADKETDPNRKNLLYAQAEQRLLKALAADSFIRDPYGESYYGALGGLYRRQNRVDDAIRAFQEAEKLTPQNSYPINNLAMLYTMKGIPDRARHMFERAIAISSRSLDGNPFDYWARFDLITAQVGLDQLDKANEHLRIVMDQLKEPGPYESFMRGLLTLRESPVPPPRIGEFIHTVQQHIDKLKKS
jgi:tetratricopeptide (TPR) repeat protein